MWRMRALVLDPDTSGLEEMLERRRRSGLDRLDEVWDGVLHMVPAPSFAHASVTHQVGVALDVRATLAETGTRVEGACPPASVAAERAVVGPPCPTTQGQPAAPRERPAAGDVGVTRSAAARKARGR
jgi:hypothetical protein